MEFSTKPQSTTMKQSSDMKKTAMKKTTKLEATGIPDVGLFVDSAAVGVESHMSNLNRHLADKAGRFNQCLRDVRSTKASSRGSTFVETLITEVGPAEHDIFIVGIIRQLMDYSNDLNGWHAECVAVIRAEHDQQVRALEEGLRAKEREYTTSHGLTKPAPPAIRLDLNKSHQQQAEAVIESYMTDGHVEGVRVLPDYDYQFLLSYGYTLYSESITSYINAILRNEFRSEGDVWTRSRKLSKKLNLPPPVVTSDATFTLEEDDGFDDAHASSDAPSVPATYDGEAIDRLFQGKETPEQVVGRIIRDASERDGTISIPRFNGLIALLRSKCTPHAVGMALSSALDRYEKTSNQAGSFYREKIAASKACEEAADARRFITCRAGRRGRLSNESFEFLQSVVKVNSDNRSAIFCNELSYQLSLYRKEGLLWFPVRNCPPKDAANEASASAVILGESPGK